MQMRLCHWAKYRKYTGTSRNDERDLDAITFNDISLFSFLYIAETALLYGVKNVVPASTLFSLGKINLPAATGSMHENNREEWWKNRSSCLETKTVNCSRSAVERLNGTVKPMAIMVYSMENCGVKDV